MDAPALSETGRSVMGIECNSCKAALYVAAR